ncbi:hypothetical protein ACQ4N7_29200 [Nodosilinea sp. AN01ver1]|uniref:hypothetical protein n=1 Tax=Nodosilinea sp. AN01ver1 TaxID=3423362 RepID=UPI003D3144F6
MFATFLFLVIFAALCLLFGEPETTAKTTAETARATLPHRTDTEGRDVTETPGLWDETDTLEPVGIAARAAAIAPPMAKTTIPTETTTAAAEIPAKTVKELRQLCTDSGVKWRNAKGKNRHLSKAEMIAALP